MTRLVVAGGKPSTSARMMYWPAATFGNLKRPFLSVRRLWVVPSNDTRAPRIGWRLAAWMTVPRISDFLGGSCPRSGSGSGAASINTPAAANAKWRKALISPVSNRDSGQETRNPGRSHPHRK
jgi:hypothetical protein